MVGPPPDAPSLHLGKFFAYPVQGCFQVAPALQPHPESWAVAGKTSGQQRHIGGNGWSPLGYGIDPRRINADGPHRAYQLWSSSFLHPRQYINDSQPILPRWVAILSPEANASLVVNAYAVQAGAVAGQY